MSINQNWTEGSILKNLLYLAWPVMINSTLTSAGSIIDMVWVGKLGSESVAGVGVASMLVVLLDAFKMGLDQGTRAMIARFIGAGDKRGANTVALQGYVITIGFALIIGTLGACLSAPILKLMGLEPAVVIQGAPYLRIQFIGIITMGLVRQNDGTMQYSGDTKTPMKIALIYRLFHIILCPFLVFGWWIFPSLGTSGAAYTNIISTSLGASIGLWILLTGRTRLKLEFNNFKFDTSLLWRIVKIGIPASVTGIERSLGQVILTWFIVPFGTVATAAHSLVLQITQFANIAGHGIGQASSVLTGQNLGAEFPERAEKIGWLGAGLYTLAMGLISVVVWFWGENLIGLFNNETTVQSIGGVFLKIQVCTYLISGVAIVLQQCLNGVGDTFPVMLVVLLSVFGIQIPLSYLLSSTILGVYGTYWAVVSGTLVMGSCYAGYFKFGRWKQKKL